MCCKLKVKAYATISKKTHKDLKISDSGLGIYEKLPYNAASPDLEVECKYFGRNKISFDYRWNPFSRSSWLLTEHNNLWQQKYYCAKNNQWALLFSSPGAT